MREDGDCKGRVVPGTDLVLEGDPVQRAADRGLEKCEPREMNATPAASEPTPV